MEDNRIEITEDAIREFFGRVIEVIDGVPSHFAFNKDEIVYQDWADRGSRSMDSCSTW
jgi:hypothetical protein